MPAPAGLKFRRKAAKIELAGAPEVQKILSELGEAHGKSSENRLARRALAAGGKPLKKAIKKEAPKVSRFRRTGKRKRKAARMRTVEQAVGFRNKRDRVRNVHEAKAGLNVAMGKDKAFAQGHIFTMGSARRRTKNGGNRGKMPADDFVKRGTKLAGPSVLQAMKFSVVKSLPGEIERVRRKHQKKLEAASAAQQAGN
jgi:hypothetical protein